MNGVRSVLVNGGHGDYPRFSSGHPGEFRLNLWCGDLPCPGFVV
jgi:hypothetical protein